MPIKVPLSWLREYIEITVPPEELATRLTLSGIEVEKVQVIGAEWDKVVVGQIATLDRHPNADRLWVTQVAYGAEKPQQVVTGAQNLRLGAKVPLAFPGAVVHNGHSDAHEKVTLKPGKLRGIESNGMVCSELELGLSGEHEGIMILDDAAPLGVPLQQVLGDVVMEIDISPNLGRIMSMVGLAREIAALLGGTVHGPDTGWETGGPPAASLIAVQIDAPELCSRYSAAVIRGVQIGPAPGWMQRRITLAGMRPVNNVVDITNYVMLELGQPLHAFDYGQVHDRQIVVRCARPGEQIETLDHEQRTLDPQTLVIADTQGAVGLAGVMGGAGSEIAPETTDILLESANFEFITIRRTARTLHLPSEASSRFERVVDQQLTVPALKRAAELMRLLAGGTIAEGYVDCFPAPKPEVTIDLTPREVERLLGIVVRASEIGTLLRRLEFDVSVPAEAEDNPLVPLTVRVPSFRNDVTIPADLVEEVARMVGYDRIPETLLSGGLPAQYVNIDWRNRERIRDLLVATGLDEILSYSPISSTALGRLGSPGPDGSQPRPYVAYDESRLLIRIANPLSSEQDIMRPALLPGLLTTLRANLRSTPRVYLFELGSIYWPATAGDIAARHEAAARGVRAPLAAGEAEMPVEPRRLGAILTGPRDPRSRFSRADAPEEQSDFFDAKGLVDTLLQHLEIAGVTYEPVAAPWYHPGRSAAVVRDGAVWGVVGELHPRVVDAWDLAGRRVYAVDLDLDAVLAAIPAQARFAGFSRYPVRTQDLAVVVPDTVPAARVTALIRETGGKLLTEATLFDLYTGAPVPSGRRSLAYSLTCEAADRTPSEDEVSKLVEKIARRLQRELGAQRRA